MTPARPSSASAAGARLSTLAMIAPNSDETGSLRAEIGRLAIQVRQYLRGRGRLLSASDDGLLARVTPLDSQGRPGPVRTVRLKQFDERGIAFQHRRPLQDRRAVVSVADAELGTLIVEIDLSWCRFQPGSRGNGQYTSGGRFVELHKRPA